MNWRAVRSSALSAHEAGSHWRAHFASHPTGNCVFSDDFFQSLSLRFTALTSSLESGRFDAPFSYNELVAALSRCHESAPGADGLPYSAFKVSFPGGVTFSSHSSISSYVSPSSPLLGSPVWSFHFSSVTATLPPLTRIVPFPSPLVLSKCSSTWSTLALHHTSHLSWTCRKVVSAGAPTLSFPASWTLCVSAIKSTLSLLSSTSRKSSILAGSKPRWFVSTTWASQVVSGTSLPIFSAALCPKSVWATRLPSHGLTLASHKGGSSHLYCSTCWWTASPPLSAPPSLVSALWTRTLSVTCVNSTRTTWSSLLIHRPTFSVLWTSCTSGVVVGGSRLVSALPNLRLWSSVLSAAAQIVLCILGASLSLWSHNTDTSVSLSLPLSLVVLTLTWSALVVMASSTKLAPGVVAKVCPSPSPRLSSSRTSFPVRLLVSSSSAMTPRHFSNSTSHSVAGAVISLGGPVLLLSQQSTGSWVSPMHSALPSDVHSRCLVACVPWTTPPLALQTLPVSSGSLPPCKAHGRTGARPLFVPFQSHILATLAFLWAPLLRLSDVGSLAKSFPVWIATCASGLQPWLPTCMVCVSMSLLTTSSLPGRTLSTHSTSLPPRCVCGGLLVGVTTFLPQAAPSATSLGLPLALSVMMWTVLSNITSPLAPPTSVLVQLGLTLAASPRPMFQCLHGTGGCSTHLTS